ncbi:hypothetical protein EXIGLDRAFT_613632, partial [Exidia glandulosa HHB12029]
MKLKSATAIEQFLRKHGLSYISEPYWKDWRRVNIYEAVAPDILHQLYQGLIRHLTAWCRTIFGDDELDARFSRVPPTFGLRRFENGISKLQRPSGAEHRAVAKQLQTCIASAGVDKRIVRATKAILDFTVMAQYECHSDDTLEDLTDAVDRWHKNKEVFKELGALVAGFNFPKMHSMQHYNPSIKLFGILPTLSTDIGERLHIVQVKDAYNASNKK